MYNNLINFLVENNYARNETGALKILCSASDMFYDYIVCESNTARISELRRKIRESEQKNPNDPRLPGLRKELADAIAGQRQIDTENAPVRRLQQQAAKAAAKAAKEKFQQDIATKQAGAEALGREAISSTPKSAAEREPTGSGGRASIVDPITSGQTTIGSLSNIQRSDQPTEFGVLTGGRFNSTGGRAGSGAPIPIRQNIYTGRMRGTRKQSDM